MFAAFPQTGPEGSRLSGFGHTLLSAAISYGLEKEAPTLLHGPPAPKSSQPFSPGSVLKAAAGLRLTHRCQPLRSPGESAKRVLLKWLTPRSRMCLGRELPGTCGRSLRELPELPTWRWQEGKQGRGTQPWARHCPLTTPMVSAHLHPPSRAQLLLEQNLWAVRRGRPGPHQDTRQ